MDYSDSIKVHAISINNDLTGKPAERAKNAVNEAIEFVVGDILSGKDDEIRTNPEFILTLTSLLWNLAGRKIYEILRDVNQLNEDDYFNMEL